jgi:hypothetical protein
MALTFYSNDPCSKCGRPVMQAVIDLHPSLPDMALQKIGCANCGPIKTKILSLRPPGRVA